jgi:hypothetical protein
MGSRGLNASIWASQGYNSSQPAARAGDWNCSLCGFSNFQRRSACMRCSTSRTGMPRSSIPAYSTPPQSLNRQENVPFSNADKSDGAFSHAVPALATHGHPLKSEKGLTDSLWAPRKRASSSQIWIKVSGSSITALKMPANIVSAETLGTPSHLGRTRLSQVFTTHSP